MTNGHPADTDLVRERASAALALVVGDGKAVTREMLARLAGIELRTVKAHVCGETTPTLSSFLTYCRTLPVEYAAAVLDLAGIVGLRKRDGAVAPGAALAELAESVAVLAEALTDGRIDHRERPRVVRELRDAIAAAEALAAQLDAESGR